MGEQAEQHLERHVIKRLGRLWNVRRFLLTWILIITILGATLVTQIRALSQYYQTLQPVPGGTYSEGVLGTFTNASPLYASGPVDSSVSYLLFAGLFKYDINNNLVGELARDWKVNERGNIYTVRLKTNLTWHDGQPLTASDVVFTYQTIQNPDAKSPLFSNWEGVGIEAKDEYTVTFTLPQALSSFPYSMTNGIVPRHLLSGIPPSQLRSITFNTVKPVGSGPFKWKTLEVSGSTPENREERIGLERFEGYAGGAPKLNGFIVRAFRSEEALKDSFEKQELDGVAGLNRMPDTWKKDIHGSRSYSFSLTSAVMIFLKNSTPALADVKVRQALTRATDTAAIRKGLGYPVQSVDEPLLRSHIGYDPKLTQLSFNKAEANKLLDEAGWVKQSNGIRSKDGQPLSIKVFSESTPEYAYVAGELQKQWRDVGVEIDFVLQNSGDLQSTIAFHNYDALLYGISLGADPDVFAYWHSTQADIRSTNRLNFSEYKSAVADRALEAGRSRSEPALRAVKYQPFLEVWRTDAPAIALYQPRFLYVTQTSIAGLREHMINTGADRYVNVENWMIRREKVNNQ